MFLDLERFHTFAERQFGSEALRQQRLVGADRRDDSWYFDIIRFFGNDKTDPAEVHILRRNESFMQHDPIVAAFSDKVERQLRSEGRLYDGPLVVRVTDAEWTRGSESLTIQPIRYGDQVASFAMDLPDLLFDRFGGSLRDYLQAMYPFATLNNSPLGTGLGVCGHLIVTEGGARYLLRMRRSGQVASLANSIGASVAGSIEFETPSENLAEMIVTSLGREVEEELGLAPGEFSITPLAYAQEMVRGDRPQLFGLITTSLTRDQVAARFALIPESRREHSEFQFVPLADNRLHEGEIAPFDFEGKMCYYLLEEWLADR